MKKIYQHTGNCDEQQNLKDILYAAMMSTPEGVTYDSLNVPMISTQVKNQVLVNHFVYPPTYYMFKRKQQNVVLELKIKTQSHESW